MEQSESSLDIEASSISPNTRKETAGNPDSRLRILLSIVLIIVTLAMYWQVGNHEFINLDDDVYVTGNLHVTQGISVPNIVWAFTATEVMYWSPVTLLSHMADVQIFGLDPRGHHLTSVFVHSLSVVLLLLLLTRLTGKVWQSSFVAALFALHPLHIESVAWVAERKDVLSAFFWFLTIFFYSSYVGKRTTSRYLLTLLCFILGLMSKPMIVTLPVVLLLLDFWPLDRYHTGESIWGRLIALVKEKIPFFMLSGLSVAITVYAQNKMGAMLGTEKLPLGLRIENAAVSYLKYVFMTLWPHDLAVYYPFPASIPIWQFLGSLVVLILVSAGMVKAGRRQPYLAVGWSWFLITLLPVIGLTQAGGQALADRFTYVPHIGLFIMAAWGSDALSKNLKSRKVILALLAAAVLLAYGAVTWHQLGYWQDNISLYRMTLERTTGNWLIHNDLGKALDEKGDLDAAIKEYRDALAIDPRFAMAHYNLGRAFAQKGDQDAAIGEYQTALALDPKYAVAELNLGKAFYEKGDFDSAVKGYRRALAIDPNYAVAHINIGVVFCQMGQWDAAIEEYQKSLELDPYIPGAHYNVGIVFLRKGDLDAAINEFQAELGINPDFPEARKSLEAALARKQLPAAGRRQ